MVADHVMVQVQPGVNQDQLAAALAAAATCSTPYDVARIGLLKSTPRPSLAEWYSRDRIVLPWTMVTRALDRDAAAAILMPACTSASANRSP